MVPTMQWLVRWGCLFIVALGTLMQLVGMASPYWIKDRARPEAYSSLLSFLHHEREDASDTTTNSSISSLPGRTGSSPLHVTRAEIDVGLWRWCVEIEAVGAAFYRICQAPALSDFPGWWRACQAMAVVGMLMGILACVCAALELHYFFRREVHFSGLIVLCAISCFVSAVGTGLSHGMFASKCTENELAVIHVPAMNAPGSMSSTFSPMLGWAFGLGASGAALIGATGIILVAFITRTYPTYQRTETEVVV